MIYFLDGNQEVIKIVRSSAVISAIQTQELPEDNSLLRDYLSVRLKNDERLFNAQYMAIKSYGGNRNAFDLYRIASELVPDNATEFTGVQVAPYELEGVVIEDLRPQNRPLNQTMNQVLEGSDWRLGYISDNLPNVTTNFYYMSVKDALKKIQELLNVEMLFKVEISGNKITDKWVEVYHQLGNRTMKRFNYGTNALSVVRESSHDELYTALIGRGKGEEVGETESGDATYGRKINFADVEWKRSAGKPVDKPKGQKYIELPSATAEYGIKLIDGRKVPRIGIVEFSDTDDPNVLISQTYQELLVRARPKVLFKASVINTGDMLIGDTVTIHRHDLDFHYQARVRKVVRDRKNNNKTQVEIGDVVHTPSTKRQGQINSALNNIASDLENVRSELTEARPSADGKSTNFYGNVEPDRKKVGDTWFRDHPSLTGESQILVWNGEAWELIMDTSETTKNAREIEEQKKDIDEAKEVADEALSEIDVAIRNAGFTSLDDTIKNAQSRANTAFDTANDLINEVSDYSLTVDGFNQTVNNYEDQVSNFRHDVNGFSNTVVQYSSAVDGYAIQVSSLTNTVDGFNSTVTNIDGRVSTLSNTIDGISSTVVGYDGRISNVEQTAEGLQATVASKVSQSQFTQLAEGFNFFVEGIADRKNLLPSMEHGAISSFSGDEYSISGYVRSPYIPVEPSSYYIASLDGSPVSHAIYSYSDIGQFIENSSMNTSYKSVGANVKYIRVVINNSNPDLKYQLEKGFMVTDYVPFISDVSSAQISMLEDNINLRVKKGDLLSQINIEADRMLFQSEKILLDADNVIFSGRAWIPSAVIGDIEADKITSGILDAGQITVVNLDVNSLSGNTSNFVQSAWNTAAGGSVSISGSGIVSTSDTGSTARIQNGVFLSTQPNGASVGYIGHAQTGSSPRFTVQTSLGAHFQVRQTYIDPNGDRANRHTLLMNANETLLDTDNFQLIGGSRRIGFGFRHYISGTSDTSLILTAHSTLTLRARESSIFSISNNGTTNHASLYADLNMQGNTVTNQSDARLKTEIHTHIESSLEKINQFRFVDFMWIRNGKADFGLIAQQIQQIDATLIVEGEDGYLGLHNHRLSMMALHAVQELDMKHETVAQVVDSHTETIHNLQRELSKANRRIEELEGAI